MDLPGNVNVLNSNDQVLCFCRVWLRARAAVVRVGAAGWAAGAVVGAVRAGEAGGDDRWHHHQVWTVPERQSCCIRSSLLSSPRWIRLGRLWEEEAVIVDEVLNLSSLIGTLSLFLRNIGKSQELTTKPQQMATKRMQEAMANASAMASERDSI